jgi:hypothetical protein
MRDLNLHEQRFIRALEGEAVRYLVIGSWALRLHGVSIEPHDIDVLIGTDPGNTRAFLRVWDRVDPVPWRRTLSGEVKPFQQVTVTLGAGHADVLTSIHGLDFEHALARCEVRDIWGMQIPVPSCPDLIAALQASERPKDRSRLAALRGEGEP